MSFDSIFSMSGFGSHEFHGSSRGSGGKNSGGRPPEYDAEVWSGLAEQAEHPRDTSITSIADDPQEGGRQIEKAGSGRGENQGQAPDQAVDQAVTPLAVSQAGDASLYGEGALDAESAASQGAENRMPSTASIAGLAGPAFKSVTATSAYQFSNNGGSSQTPVFQPQVEAQTTTQSIGGVSEEGRHIGRSAPAQAVAQEETRNVDGVPIPNVQESRAETIDTQRNPSASSQMGQVTRTNADEMLQGGQTISGQARVIETRTEGSNGPTVAATTEVPQRRGNAAPDVLPPASPQTASSRPEPIPRPSQPPQSPSIELRDRNPDLPEFTPQQIAEIDLIVHSERLLRERYEDDLASAISSKLMEETAIRLGVRKAGGSGSTDEQNEVYAAKRNAFILIAEECARLSQTTSFEVDPLVVFEIYYNLAINPGDGNYLDLGSERLKLEIEKRYKDIAKNLYPESLSGRGLKNRRSQYGRNLRDRVVRDGKRVSVIKFDEVYGTDYPPENALEPEDVYLDYHGKISGSLYGGRTQLTTKEWQYVGKKDPNLTRFAEKASDEFAGRITIRNLEEAFDVLRHEISPGTDEVMFWSRASRLRAYLFIVDQELDWRDREIESLQAALYEQNVASGDYKDRPVMGHIDKLKRGMNMGREIRQALQNTLNRERDVYIGKMMSQESARGIDIAYSDRVHRLLRRI